MGRRLLFGLCVVGMLASLSGCGGDPTSVQPNDAAAKERMRALGAQERGTDAAAPRAGMPGGR
jgi:hypothetical protein